MWGQLKKTVDTFKDVTKSESEQGSRDDVSIQQPRSMVELGSQSSESGDKDSMVQGDGLNITGGKAAAVPALT